MGRDLFFLVARTVVTTMTGVAVIQAVVSEGTQMTGKVVIFTVVLATATTTGKSEWGSGW
jgi:hypothetical protein